MAFTWEDMTNYVGRREEFIGNWPTKWTEKYDWRCGCIQDVFHTGTNRNNHLRDKYLRQTVYKIKGNYASIMI
jgi:hypothetical protein